MIQKKMEAIRVFILDLSLIHISLLAALADGVSEKEACIGQGKVYAAEKVFTDAYDQQYKKYKRMYSALKNIMQE